MFLFFKFQRLYFARYFRVLLTKNMAIIIKILSKRNGFST